MPEYRYRHQTGPLPEYEDDGNPYAPPTLDDDLPSPWEVDLRVLAQRDRTLRIGMYANALLWVLGLLIALFLPELVVIVLFWATMLVVCMMNVGFIDLLGQSLGDRFPFRFPCGFSMIIPGWNFLVILFMLARSSRVLRAAGLQPGWFGVDPKTIPVQEIETDEF